MVGLRFKPQVTSRTHGANIGHGPRGPRGPIGPKWEFFNGTRKIANLEVFHQQNDETCLKTLWRSPRGPYGGPKTRASGHESHTRSQYRSRHQGAQRSQGAQTAFFQWDSQNRKFGGDISKKRLNMLKNPLEVPKRTLWWGLNSSLRSRLAHTDPISVTAQGGQSRYKRL